MKANKLELLLINFVHILAVAMLVANILKQSTLASIVFAMLFVLVFALVASVWSRKFTKRDLYVLMLLLATVLVVLVETCAESVVEVNVGYFSKLFIFITSVLYLYISSRLYVDKHCAVFLTKLIEAFSIFIIAVYILAHDQLYVYNIYHVGLLYFNFGNPNFAAMVFFALCIFNLTFAIQIPNKVGRLYHLAVGVFMVYLCVETQCRNVLLVLALFCAQWIVVFFRKTGRVRINKLIAALVAIWPLLFSAAYMIISARPEIMSFFGFMANEGKELDSRVLVWTSAFENIIGSPLLGSYSSSLEGQMHNTHLDIWRSYGVAILSMVLCMLTGIIHNDGKVHTTKRSILYAVGFSVCIVLGMAEAALFAGSRSFFILVGTFLLLRNYENDSSEEVVCGP